MSSFFDRVFGRARDQSNKSASRAKERLQFVLVHDRINLPPERLSEMKARILEVISEFVEVSIDDVDIALRQNDRNSNIIVAEIPFSHSIHQSDDDTDENDDINSQSMDIKPADDE